MPAICITSVDSETVGNCRASCAWRLKRSSGIQLRRGIFLHKQPRNTVACSLQSRPLSSCSVKGLTAKIRNMTEAHIVPVSRILPPGKRIGSAWHRVAQRTLCRQTESISSSPSTDKLLSKAQANLRGMLGGSGMGIVEIGKPSVCIHIEHTSATTTSSVWGVVISSLSHKSHSPAGRSMFFESGQQFSGRTSCRSSRS